MNLKDGKYKLKVTKWFEMKTDYNLPPQGQVEEGIEKVEWIDPKDLHKVLSNSYENIKLLFENEEK